MSSSTIKTANASKSTLYLVLGCAIAAASSIVVLAQKPVSLVQETRHVEQRPASASVPTVSPTTLATSQTKPTNPNVISLQDEHGKEVKPSAVLAYGQDLLFLSPNCLWISAGAMTELGAVDQLTLKKLELPKSFGRLKFQELNNFALHSARQSIIGFG